jgi:hypothetical protein
MKINQTFKVTFNTNKYPKQDASVVQEGTIQDKVEKIDLEFELDEKMAGNFLFKFSPAMFKIEDYNVGIRFDQFFKMKNIILTKDDDVYIVTNMVQLLSQIHEGYFRIISMQKLNDIMEFDFNIEDDGDEIHEEFEDEMDDNEEE